MPDWTDDRSPRERVRTIAETVTDPVSANWVAEQADVGWQTARDELDQLADRGTVRRVERDGDFRYVPDFTRLYTERIRELAIEHSREELREEIVRAKEDAESIASEYDVDDRAELERTLSDDSIDAAAARERERALREWEEVADDLRLLEHALRLHDDLRDVDPYLDSERPDGSGEERFGTRVP